MRPAAIFAPLAIVNFSVDTGVSEPECTIEPGQQALVVFRFHGVPFGTSYLTPSGATLSRGDLLTAAEAHSAMLARRVTTDRLLTVGFAEAIDPARLLEAPHARPERVWPAATIAVCTRGRPDDLPHCLETLQHLAYPGPLERIVVDNAPVDTNVERLIRDAHPNVRYLREPRPGLDWARNRAIAEASGEILAFTDDDAMAETGWLPALVAPFLDQPDVMATAGLVLPSELETEAQLLFERHGGLGRGHAPRWIRAARNGLTTRLANPTTYGAGANMAFRRTVFDAVGGFDPALDAGTRSAAGGDTEMLFRIVKAGYSFVYVPGAVVRHRHRRDYAAIRAQLSSWLIGVGAALTALARQFPEERSALTVFATRLIGLYYPRRLVAATLGASLSVDLVRSELSGAWKGWARYAEARREADEVQLRFPDERELPAPRVITPPARARRQVHRVEVDVSRPLPSALPGTEDTDIVEVVVVNGRRRVGRVRIICNGAPVGCHRLADEIAASLSSSLVAPADIVRALQLRARG